MPKRKCTVLLEAITHAHPHATCWGSRGWGSPGRSWSQARRKQQQISPRHPQARLLREGRLENQALLVSLKFHPLMAKRPKGQRRKWTGRGCLSSCSWSQRYDSRNRARAAQQRGKPVSGQGPVFMPCQSKPPDLLCFLFRRETFHYHFEAFLLKT